MGFFACFLRAEPYWMAMVNTLMPLRPIYLSAIFYMSHRQKLSELGVLGAHYNWGARCAVQTLHSSGRSWEFPPCFMALCQRWSLWWDCISAFPVRIFNVDVFLFAWYGVVTQLVSGLLAEGIAPCVAIHSVPPREEGCSGASYVTILVPPWHFYFLIFFQKELEKQERIKRNQQLDTIAKEHYKKVLLRKKGLEPWKRLRMQSKQNIQV